MAKNKKTQKELENKLEKTGKLTPKEARRLRSLKGWEKKRKNKIKKEEANKKRQDTRKKNEAKKKRANRNRKITRIAKEYNISRAEAEDELRIEEQNQRLLKNINKHPKKDYLNKIQRKPTIFEWKKNEITIWIIWQIQIQTRRLV